MLWPSLSTALVPCHGPTSGPPNLARPGPAPDVCVGAISILAGFCNCPPQPAKRLWSAMDLCRVGGVDLKPPLNVGAYFTYTHTLKHTNTRTCIHEQKQTNYQTLTQDRMIAPDRMIPPVKHQRFATTHLECRSRNSGTLPRQRFSGSARDPIPQSQTATSQSVILHPCIAPVSPAPPPGPPNLAGR